MDEETEADGARVLREAKEAALDAMIKAMTETDGGMDKETAIAQATKHAERFATIMAVGAMDPSENLDDPWENETEAQRAQRLFGSDADLNEYDDFYSNKIAEA